MTSANRSIQPGQGFRTKSGDTVSSRALSIRSLMVRALSATALVAGAFGGGLSFGGTPAQAEINAPNCTAPNDAECYKEIRIVNNTEGTIYPVIQGSIQTQQALGDCPKGDVWLQRALANTTRCFPVNNTYYIYINPKTGIKKGEVASVMLPWWTKLDLTKDKGADEYVDWWRAGRFYVFDDQTALNDSYTVNSSILGKKVFPVTGNSPSPKCAPASATNKCIPSEFGMYRAVSEIPGSTIRDQTPFQLNEWTFADVEPLAKGGKLIDLNVGYNVSNVDQLYLPVALAPIRPTDPKGYMGSTMSVPEFRKRLVAFTGANADLTNATKWPIYNNPINPLTRKPLYPNAGIRVPSPLLAFNYYMDPSYINGVLTMPQMIPLPKPFDRTKLPTDLRAIEVNWQNCTTAPYTNCQPGMKDWYLPIKKAMDDSYKAYLAKCYNALTSPKYMAPDSQNLPKLETYMRFLHGWVPFRVDNVKGQDAACTPAKVPDLPLTEQSPAQNGVAPVNYMAIQYDFDKFGTTGTQRFNPYTQLIHGKVADGFLDSSSYAFSIDDHESFQSFSGSGLVIAIGGPNGLPLNKRVPQKLPPFYDWYTITLTPGAPASPSATGWAAYGLCSDTADKEFPERIGGAMGLDPRTTPQPCTITFKDTTGKLFKMKILKFNTAGSMPYQIWPEFTPTGPVPFDPTVLSCPNPNDDWCKYTNEVAKLHDPAKPGNAPTFSLSARVPN